MRIAHLSTSDIVGGAARSAYRLHSGLKSLGHDSKMIVAQRSAANESIIQLPYNSNLKRRIARKIKRVIMDAELRYASLNRPSGYEPFNADKSTYNQEFYSLEDSADIINIHWAARFLDYKTHLPYIAKNHATVWTLHDMNAFTGGCHYDDHCGRYQAKCGKCPQLGSQNFHDLSQTVWRRKYAALESISSEKITFVSPSQWLANEAKKSSLLNRFEMKVIPYGLDLEEFSPRDKVYSRSVLGLPQEDKIVLFVAFDVESKRKGFTHLLNSLQSFEANNRPFLISIGSAQNKTNWGERYLHLGSITNDRLLSLVYSAADIFVIPSLQDNLPNTVLEAMACGLPTIGFAAGGIPDMIRENETGRLVSCGDENGLYLAISNTLQDSALLKYMSNNCRLVAESDYSLHRQAQNYVNLYDDIKESN